MQTSQFLRFAGDVNIEKINIISSGGFYQDITNQVLSIQIFEDLFSPFITGNLVIKDTLDLVNLFPLVGEETLELKLSTPTLKTGNINARFYIYKMTDRDMMGDKYVAYQLHFTSLDCVVDLNKSISKTFSGKVSDIAKNFIEDKSYGLNSKTPYYIEETANSTKYTSNFWSPIKNLMYLIDSATNKKGSPSYVFFENRSGYNFVSLDSLYNQPVFQEFYKDNYTRDERPGGGSLKDISKDYQRISVITIPTAFDYISRIRSGMYGSKQYTYDLTTKKLGSKNFDMLQNYSSRNHLNDNPLASKNVIYRYNSKVTTAPKYYGNFSIYGDVTNSSINQERLSILKQIETTKLEILAPGRFDYTVGKKVKLNLNKIEPVSKQDKDTTDRMFSGNYIISAINHYIDREKHECVMELVKDSLMLDLNKGK